MAQSVLFTLFCLGILLPSTKTKRYKLEIENIQSGSWYFYDLIFSFEIGGKVFLHLQGKSGQGTTLEMNPTGSFGDTMETFQSPFYYIQFPYTIEGRHYMLGHGENKRWFTKELLPGGKTAEGSLKDGVWYRLYHTNFPFSINGRQFCYGQSSAENHWFVQELLPNGKLGREVSDGSWERDHYPQFPFAINGRQFFYAQSRSDNHWFIRELLPDGGISSETDHGFHTEHYPVQFPFNVDGQQFFYRRDSSANKWFMQMLLPGGKIGKIIKQGSMGPPYRFSYNVGGSCFLMVYEPKNGDKHNGRIDKVILWTSGLKSEMSYFKDYKLEPWDMQVGTRLRKSEWFNSSILQ